MVKLELSKFSVSTEFPWSKNIPLALSTIRRISNGNHKLTPYEIITGRLVSLAVKPHIDTPLIYPKWHIIANL